MELGDDVVGVASSGRVSLLQQGHERGAINSQRVVLVRPVLLSRPAFRAGHILGRQGHAGEVQERGHQVDERDEGLHVADGVDARSGGRADAR